MRPRKIVMDHQIFLNFVVNSPQSVLRITLKTLSEKYFVKNVNSRKKPHPNRLTLNNARGSHVLKNFNWRKFIKVVVFFAAARNCGCYAYLSEEDYLFCTIF